MNGWNRLFVIVAVCWALVAPFLVMADVNGQPYNRKDYVLTLLTNDTAPAVPLNST